jgi:hypothetical protein
MKEMRVITTSTRKLSFVLFIFTGATQELLYNNRQLELEEGRLLGYYALWLLEEKLFGGT